MVGLYVRVDKGKLFKKNKTFKGTVTHFETTKIFLPEPHFVFETGNIEFDNIHSPVRVVFMPRFEKPGAYSVWIVRLCVCLFVCP